MTTLARRKKSGWMIPATILTLVTIAAHHPVLRGSIPFPRDSVLQFAPWADFKASTGPQQVANIGDLASSFYPFRHFAVEAVRKGSVPLWNPYFLGGAPVLASAQSAVFYPLTLLFYVLPLPAAWTASILLHMFLSGFFCWLFLRSIGASQAGAVFSGIAVSCCGFMTAWQGQAMGASATWLPLIFYAVHRLRQSPSGGSVTLAALAFAMPVMAGHPETAVHLTLAGSAWALFLGLGDRRFILRFAAAGLLALGLTAVQLLPTIEWTGQLGGRLDSIWPPLDPFQIFAFVSRDVLRDPNSGGIRVPEAAAYAGMATLLLAPLAAFHKRKRETFFFAGMILIGLSVAYGGQPFRWIAEHAPVLKTVKNWRLILIADFGLAVLSGLGVSVLASLDSFRDRQRRKIVVCVMASLVVAIVMIYLLQHVTTVRVEATRRPSSSRALLVIAAIPVLLRIMGVLRVRAFEWLVCGILALDMVTFSTGFAGESRPAEIYPNAPLFDFLKQRADPMDSRVVQVGNPYIFNGNMIYDVSSFDGYEVTLERIRNLCADFIEARADAVVLERDKFFELRDRRMDLWNVRYFVLGTATAEFKTFVSRPDQYSLVWNDRTLAVFENPRALPRAFAVPTSGILMIDNESSQIERVKDPSFDPAQSVVISSKSGVSKHISSDDFQSTIERLSANPNEYVWTTNVSEDAILVVSQTYYPGWKAFVDGHEVPVLDVDYGLTGFSIPAGIHRARLVFYSPPFRLGLVISIASIGVLLLVRAPKIGLENGSNRTG